MPMRIWRGLALIALYHYDNSLVAANAALSSASSTTNEQSTCATGSVNWITHTLPQQCLRTAWAPQNTSTTSKGSTVSNVPTKSVSQSALNVTLASEGQPPAVAHNATQSESIPTASDQDAETQSVEDQGKSEEPSQTQSEASIAETEADSALQSANFLSFEEWKQQKLGDAGQSAEALARARSTGEAGERHRPGAALDTLGEDSEIDIDFSGFGGGSHSRPSNAPGERSAGSDATASSPSGPSGARSKDAGRTCKERFNYASFDCAANVLKTNPRCKSSSSVLVENKDSYMLNECSMDNKFLIVELCEYIQIDTVVLSNFEFFSSMFRTFRVSVSDRYPVKIDKWRDLGTYEARNTREIQAFLVENPLIWAKYIRIEFLTHYGNEYYCPLSLLRVHGTTMMEDYRHQEELARGEVDTSDDEIELTNEVVAVPAASSNIGPPEAIITPVSPYEAKSVQPPEPIAGMQPEESASPASPTEVSQSSSSSTESPATSVAASGVPLHERDVNLMDAAIASMQDQISCSSPSSSSSESIFTDTTPSSSSASPLPAANATVSAGAGANSSIEAASSSVPANATTATSSATSIDPVTNASTVTVSNSHARGNFSTAQNSKESSASAREQSAAESAKSVPQSGQTKPIAPATNSTASTQQVAPVPPAATQPATQESFFKTLSKRVSLLEANATLSLQYIESQSMLLRDAFTAVEKRQIAKTASFLTTLNETVLKELASARTDYDQLWQSTVLELANQREEGKRERELLNEQVRLLAEEVVGQRRLMAVQVTVVLVILALFLFTKAAPSQASDAAANLGMGDIRILQGMQALVARGRSAKRSTRPPTPASGDDNISPAQARSRWGWESPLRSPPPTRPVTSHGMDETQEGAWDDLLAFVDENVRPRKKMRSKEGETQYLKQKPLPPAPRPELRREDSETGDSDYTNASPSVDTTMIRHHVNDGNETDSPLESEPLPRSQGRLGVAGRMPLGRRVSSFRAAKSAPTTPQIESSPLLEDRDKSAEAGPPTSTEGAGTGGRRSPSMGLGIGVDR